jgi:hypothetical protein
MIELNKSELRNVDGGSTCPTYYIKDNSDGLAYSVELGAPVVWEVIKTFAFEIVKFFI